MITKTGAPTARELELLAEQFELPKLPAIRLCDATLKPPDQVVPLDVPTLIKAISSADYTLTPTGNYVVVVSRTPPASGAELKTPSQTLDQLNNVIKGLLQAVPANQSGFSVELAIPHAAAFGSALATQLTGISSLFTAKPTGRNRIAISTVSGLPPSCDDWLAFRRDVRELAWSVHPEPSEARLTATDAGAMATALGMGSSPSPQTPAAAPASPGAGVMPAAANTSTPAATQPLTITVTPPPPAGTKPAAGATTTSTTATTITVAQAPPAAPAAAAAPAAPAAVAGAPTPGISIGSIEPDLLVFSDTNPGDDAQITEKKRVAAILDLPRPEMSISAWVMQNSSTDPDSVNQISQRVRQEVRTYNDGLESTIIHGWEYLQNAMSQESYFDKKFYNYIARRVILDGRSSTSEEADPSSVQQQAHDFLNELSALSDPIGKAPWNRDGQPGGARQDYLGACGQMEYCLGYTTLFHPAKPHLTDLLLALIAAANPVQEVNCSADYAERAPRPTLGCPSESSDNKYDPTLFNTCKNGESLPCRIWAELKLTRDRRPVPLPTVDPLDFSAEDCEERDYLGVLQSMLRPQKSPAEQPQPIMFLNCFRQKAVDLFKKPTGETSVSQLGLLRAAVADFLFNYKMSQQYPHEFVAYDLTTSAQAMNAAMRPLVEAFVRDVAAYQAVLKRRLGFQIEDINKRLTLSSVFDKPRFFNNAIVTVNTIASSEASVDTTVESYLESLNPPTLSGLAGALSGATSPSSTSPTALSSLLGATRFNEAQLIAAGLTQFASSHIHIGRELSVDIKPESLLGANSAELQVTLKADDEAASGVYSSGGNGSGTDAEVSRFGKSDTITRIRVDSLKLFEVSSFASQLMAPKKRFPLLPIPGLEMPYFGSFLSVPLRPAREFHASMAVMSAIVIPTAADLAFSARFVADRLLAPENSARDASSDVTEPCYWPTDAADPNTGGRPPCRTRPMVSLRDFNGKPIREFNRMMTHCFVTEGRSATPNLIPLNDTTASHTCASLNFRDVLGDVE